MEERVETRQAIESDTQKDKESGKGGKEKRYPREGSFPFASHHSSGFVSDPILIYIPPIRG